MTKFSYTLLVLAFFVSHAQAQEAAVPMQQESPAVEQGEGVLQAPEAVVPSTVAPVSTLPMTAAQMVDQANRSDSFLTPQEKAFAKQEEELLRQIRLAQMQLELLELQKKMRDGASKPPDSVNTAVSDTSVIDAPPREPFVLVSIWGDDTGLQADLLVKGRRNTVRSGSSLPDGWRVARVSQSAVEITKGSDRRTLALGNFQ